MKNGAEENRGLAGRRKSSRDCWEILREETATRSGATAINSEMFPCQIDPEEGPIGDTAENAERIDGGPRFGHGDRCD